MAELRILHGFELDGAPRKDGLRPHDRAVLGYVAAQHRAVLREDVVELIWGSSSTTYPRKLHSLAQSLYRIRRSCPGVLRPNPKNELALESNVLVDLQEITGPTPSRRALLQIERPISVLAGLRAPSVEFEHWRDRASASARSAAYKALRACVQQSIEAGEYDAAIQAGAKAAMHLPMCEEVAEGMMEAAIVVYGHKTALRRVLDELDDRWPHVNEAATALRLASRRTARPAIRHLANLPSDPPDMIGRDAELRALHSAVLEAIGPLIVTISGEPGVGKTRLLKAFCAAVRRDVGRPLYVKCYPTQARSPYATMSGILSTNLTEADWSRMPPPTLEILREIEYANKRLPLTDRWSDQYRAAVRATHIRDALLSLLKLLAGDGKAILILDDAQWLDDASAAILGQLLMSKPESGVVVILSIRARGRDAGASELLLQETEGLRRLEIPLHPLPKHLIDQLVRAIGRDLDVTHVSRIVQECCGNPLLVREFVAAAREDRTLPISGSVTAIVDSRLNSLTSLERQVIEVVAIAGRPLRSHEIAYAANQQRLSVEFALMELTKASLVRRSRDDYEVGNSMAESRCRENLPAVIQRYIHHRLARSARREGLPRTIIADHMLKAKTGRSTVRSCIAAARECMDGGAYESAIQFLAAAVRAARGTDGFARVKQAYYDQLLELGRLDAAADAALDVSDCPPDRMAEYIKLIRDLSKGARPTRDLYQCAVGLYDSLGSWATGSLVRADVCATTAELAAYCNDTTRATEALERIVHIARHESDTRNAVTQIAMASRLACLTEGALDPVELSTVSLKLAERANDPVARIYAALANAAALWWVGRLRESIKVYDRLAGQCTDPGLMFFRWRIDVERSAVLIDAGDAGRAMRMLAECLQGCSAKERVYALANLGAAAFETGDTGVLSSCGNALEHLNRQFEAGWMQVVAESYLGYSELLCGDIAAADTRKRSIDRILAQRRGSALNEPSYVLLFCTRVEEEVRGRDRALADLLRKMSQSAGASRSATMRLDIEVARLKALSGEPVAAQLSRLEEQAESIGATGSATCVRWLKRQKVCSAAYGWRRFVQATLSA